MEQDVDVVGIARKCRGVLEAFRGVHRPTDAFRGGEMMERALCAQNTNGALVRMVVTSLEHAAPSLGVSKTGDEFRIKHKDLLDIVPPPYGENVKVAEHVRKCRGLSERFRSTHCLNYTSLEHGLTERTDGVRTHAAGAALWSRARTAAFAWTLQDDLGTRLDREEVRTRTLRPPGRHRRSRLHRKRAASWRRSRRGIGREVARHGENAVRTAPLSHMHSVRLRSKVVERGDTVLATYRILIDGVPGVSLECRPRRRSFSRLKQSPHVPLGVRQGARLMVYAPLHCV
ncbi:hypothetical protein TRAPUB_14104 [Trametes pubescens]|uniref:Uncharacterized protein n=1 Tax=Trametes pubescens TaxID=154538 RepID=A0A1M2VPC5_TRAPU|nr:hypothetical protein TRAPUB_3580 [Trametes pubescens]OJT09418.1 hypothetical protein TRAPUB_14104 [Trametes pubescens]